MNIGERLHCRACKTDGTVYRTWNATIESVTTDSIVTIAPAGSLVFNLKSGERPIRHHYRSYYWSDKFYNLIEIFEPSGKLFHIYINVASPPEFEDGMMSFKDHELDVSRYLPKPAQLIDEDEFAEAVITYQYSKEFQEKLYAAAREALELANNWIARPVPVFGETNVE